MDKIKNVDKIVDIILNSKNVVFFGGAGISTESGIPDFRSVDGLYNMQYKFPPEVMLSATFFKNEPKEFYRFYKEKCLKPMINSKPNVTHIALAELEKKGILKAIVTQNIDDLHYRAGSKTVYDLHGSSFRNYCIKCKKKYSTEYVLNSEDVPICDCGGIIRPDIVLYEERLNDEIIDKSINVIKCSDVLIVAGTSLVVYPAAGFINYYQGDKLILINKTEVPNEDRFNYAYYGKAGDVFKNILMRMDQM